MAKYEVEEHMTIVAAVNTLNDSFVLFLQRAILFSCQPMRPVPLPECWCHWSRGSSAQRQLLGTGSRYQKTVWNIRWLKQGCTPQPEDVFLLGVVEGHLGGAVGQVNGGLPLEGLLGVVMIGLLVLIARKMLLLHDYTHFLPWPEECQIKGRLESSMWAPS